MARELIRRARFQPYANGERYNLRLYATGRVDALGKAILAYRFADSHGVIFEGDDFHASPMYPIDSRQSMIALMGFLTLRPGDTDPEYFAPYTERQLTFTRSRDCEALASIVAMFEARESN